VDIIAKTGNQCSIRYYLTQELSSKAAFSSEELRSISFKSVTNAVVSAPKLLFTRPYFQIRKREQASAFVGIFQPLKVAWRLPLAIAQYANLVSDLRQLHDPEMCSCAQSAKLANKKSRDDVRGRI
jgi:hypothetical protein